MKFTKEIKIALASILGIVVLFFGLQFLKGLSVFSSDNTMYVAFTDATGLAVSSPVYANGYRVGVVKALDYDYDPHGKIVAEIGLNKQMRVPAGSRAELASDLLGNIKINLVLSDDPLNMIAVGDTISGGDSIMISLNQLLADPALRNTLHNVEGMTGNLNATSQELKLLSASLNREVPTTLNKVNGVLDNTHQLTHNLTQLDIESMNAKVNQTLANVEQMTQSLNSNEGTLGLLMRDKSLYNNLNATAASADSLLTDLKAHPKRYVHFSIFGKKDK